MQELLKKRLLQKEMEYYLLKSRESEKMTTDFRKNTGMVEYRKSWNRIVEFYKTGSVV